MSIRGFRGERVRDRMVVAVEAHVGRLTRAHGLEDDAGERMGGQWQEPLEAIFDDQGHATLYEYKPKILGAARGREVATALIATRSIRRGPTVDAPRPAATLPPERIRFERTPNSAARGRRRAPRAGEPDIVARQRPRRLYSAGTRLRPAARTVCRRDRARDARRRARSSAITRRGGSSCRRGVGHDEADAEAAFGEWFAGTGGRTWERRRRRTCCR
jgi:hypothetical protein